MLIDKAASSRTIAVGDLDIHYHEAGEGPPLICIHGGGAGASGWSNYRLNIGDLSSHFRVLALDLPCFGRSSKRQLREPRIAFFARTVLGFMDALHIGSAHFIGNSLGGATTLKLALEAPDRADRLALMGPAVSLSLFTPQPSEGLKHLAGYYAGTGPSREKMRALCEIMVADPAQITDALVEERYQDSIDPDILANPLGKPTPESPFEPLWADLHRVGHDTLLIWGREDRVIPVDSALFIMGQMPRARLHVFPNCGHWAQVEKAEEFNTLVTGFLRGQAS